MIKLGRLSFRHPSLMGEKIKNSSTELRNYIRLTNRSRSGGFMQSKPLVVTASTMAFMMIVRCDSKLIYYTVFKNHFRNKYSSTTQGN